MTDVFHDRSHVIKGMRSTRPRMPAIAARASVALSMVIVLGTSLGFGAVALSGLAPPPAGALGTTLFAAPTVQGPATARRWPTPAPFQRPCPRSGRGDHRPDPVGDRGQHLYLLPGRVHGEHPRDRPVLHRRAGQRGHRSHFGRGGPPRCLTSPREPSSSIRRHGSRRQRLERWGCCQRKRWRLLFHQLDLLGEQRHQRRRHLQRQWLDGLGPRLHLLDQHRHHRRGGH